MRNGESSDGWFPIMCQTLDYCLALSFSFSFFSFFYFSTSFFPLQNSSHMVKAFSGRIGFALLL